MQRILLLLLLTTSVSYGQSGRSQASAMATTLLSGQDSALHLFEQALEYIQRNPFKKDISWDSLIATSREQLSAATSVRDAHTVINQCLQQVQGAHSFVMPARHAALYHNDTAQLKRIPALKELVGAMSAEMIDQGIGYISVPWISSSDPAVCALIADSLQSLIGHLAKQGATRWIIDLRKNIGGNCWPMLAGIGPLLGNGVCGYFVRKARVTDIRYREGAALHNNTTMCKVSNPVTLTDQQRQQIVVLTGPKTSSSGEILALAFKGMPQVRLMGEPTAGLTTANTTYDLFDGSTLVVTICQEADRTGRICEGKIVPDDIIKSDPLKEEDVVKANALMWLQSN
ncbi:S41 family peptidase [Paraflavitalea soli]|nr:S41 family peptidase [Paraflavitalea soli]